jgi:uncharacterized protein YbcV (DUF1398 family)
MFTLDQINEKLSKVRTGADFPALAKDLKEMGITYYETGMAEGRSIYHGQNGVELHGGPAYDRIEVADSVNAEQLKLDIANHQQGGSDYFGISRQCAENGIEKWAVCLTSMTCTYLDKAGNKVWIEEIPDVSDKKPSFTVAQIKLAHSKVKSGADFPAYIQEIKKLGVTRYETFVADGSTDYYGTHDYQVSSGGRYDTLVIAGTAAAEQFKSDLKDHQQGKTDFPSFCNSCARWGIEKWAVSTEKMTCTYYDKAGNEILVEEIPD